MHEIRLSPTDRRALEMLAEQHPADRDLRVRHPGGSSELEVDVCSEFGAGVDAEYLVADDGKILAPDDDYNWHEWSPCPA